MIISDINYLEVTTAADSLEGGVDFSANFTSFKNVFHAIQTTSTSGAGGSSSTTSAIKSLIETFGGSIVYLG